MLLSMAYTAVLQDYSKEDANGKYPTFAYKTGLSSRAAAWEWVINTAQSIWPNSAVSNNLRKKSQRELKETVLPTRAIDIRMDKEDAAPDLHLAVTINDLALYADINNFAPVQYPQY